jgi:ribosomal subunit interface protein
MVINVSARHCTIGASVRRRAEDRLRRMIRFEPRIESVDVIFERDHGLYAVEARTFVTGRSVVVAHAAATDPRAALDQAVSRTASQLRRQRERGRDHSAGRPAVFHGISMKGPGSR